MPPDTLFYTSKRGPKSRISLDFTAQLYSGISNELKSPSTQNFIQRTRIPNERELYGLLVKALLKVGDNEDVGHIATEIQVNRITEDDPDSKSTGRVDLLVNYRKTIFLIEVKVARVSVNGKTLGSVEDDSHAARTWKSAIHQLKTINHKDVEALFERKVVKLALLLCIYYDGKNRGSQDQWQTPENQEELVFNHHEEICRQVSQGSTGAIEYDWKSMFTTPIIPHRRKSKSVEQGKRVALYGFSLLGATVE